MAEMGAAFLAGGLRHPVQTFATLGVRAQIGMMALAAMAILIPSIVAVIGGGRFVSQSATFSVVVSFILLAVYLLSLVFSLRTHVHLFQGEARAGHDETHGASWSISRAVGVMVVVTLLIVWMSDSGEEHHGFCAEWPLVVLGSLGGRLKTAGRFLQFPTYQSAGHRTVANFYLALLHAVGDQRKSFGEIDPALEGLRDVNQTGALEEIMA